MHRDDPVIHPWGIVLTLVLMGISALFAGVCAAYLYTIFSTGIEAPRPSLYFLINIPVLVCATILLRKAYNTFARNGVKKTLEYAALSAFFTVVFIVLQVLGWNQFFQHVPMQASQARSFLFVLSGLHLLHVIAGIPFLLWFIWQIKSLFNQRFPDLTALQRYLKGLVRYWNYLDILWILLVVILSGSYILNWL